MKIQEVINCIKQYHKGTVDGNAIDEQTTRDQILYGDPHQECTGIVTTCWATADVLTKAAQMGANLVITHEALFWNHGDHIDWLKETHNQTFEAKAKLLDDTGIVVWRNHDYIHSGIPMEDGSYTDGIFYGVAEKLGWTSYIVKDIHNPLRFELPQTTVRELAEQLIEKLKLNGVKIIGDLDQTVTKVRIPFHILGDARDLITEIDQEGTDCLLTMEVVDFTVAEYIRDSSMLGLNKAIIGMGHFNLEEPGMDYMLKYLPKILPEEIPTFYIQSGDMYDYVTKKN